MNYDLEQRTLDFAINTRELCKQLKHHTINLVYIKQLIRCSSSIGANYIEANENLGQKDFQFRLKVARKEAKESIFFLQLLIIDEVTHENAKNNLIDEAMQLRKILSAIILKARA